MKAPARVAVVATTVVVALLGLAAPALADGPASDAWPDGDSRSWLEDIVFFGGSVLALIVVISLFALLTARRNYVPPPPSTDVERAPGHEPAHH